MRPGIWKSSFLTTSLCLDGLEVECLGGVQRVGLRAQVDTVQGPTQSDGVTRWDML